MSTNTSIPPSEDKSAIIEKIRKLLALSQSKNQHEAELAAQRASELMQKYQIAQSVVEASSVKSGKEKIANVYFTVPDLRMKYQWVIHLGHACAKLFDGTILTNRGLHGTGFTFVGLQSEIPLMESMFTHLYNAWKGFVEFDLERAKQDHSMNSWEEWQPKHTMKFKHGHGQGYAYALFNRCKALAESRKQAVAASSSAGSAMIVLRDNAVSQWLTDNQIRTVKMKQTSGSSSGFDAGRRAGNNVAIGGAISTSSPAAALR